MAKKIFLEDKGKAHLRRVFKCSNVTVWKALTFQSESKQARKIRFVALKELGGVPNWKPEDIETTHEESEKTMTQTFGARVKLIASKSDTSVEVYVDGKVVRRAHCEDIPSFIALQDEVQYMAMSLR